LRRLIRRSVLELAAGFGFGALEMFGFRHEVPIGLLGLLELDRGRWVRIDHPNEREARLTVEREVVWASVAPLNKHERARHIVFATAALEAVLLQRFPVGRNVAQIH
jgi:hypothetical protein